MDAKQWAKVARKYGWEDLGEGNVKSSPVRLSFANLVTGKRYKGLDSSPERWGATLLMAEGDDADALVDALHAVIHREFGSDAEISEPSGDKVTVTYSKGGAKKRVKLDWPIMDQGEKAMDGYADGSLHVSAYAYRAPPVVDARLKPITDESEIYSGCYAFVTIKPYWSSSWDKLCVGLEAVQKIADGERFGGGAIDVNTAFGEVDASEFGGDDDAAALLAM